jgi:hypothetical protein
MAKNSPRITNFSCLFSGFEKKIAKKEQTHCVEHGNHTDMLSIIVIGNEYPTTTVLLLSYF